MRIAIAQVNNEADGNLIIFKVVEVGAPEGSSRTKIEGPSYGMHDFPCLMLARVDIPDFLKPDTIVLSIRVCIEFEFCNQLFAKMASAAFGEEGVPAVQLLTGNKASLLLAVCINTHIPGCNAFH